MRFLPYLLLAIAVSAVLGFTFWAVQAPPEVIWTSAPGWSWSRRVAISSADLSAPQAAPLAVDDAGQLYLLTISAGPAGPQPVLTAYGRDLEQRWRRELAGPQGQVGQPALLWDGQALRVFWLAEERLVTARLSPAGESLAEAQAFAGAGPASSFAAASDGRGAAFVWYAGTPAAPGIFALAPDDRAGPPQLIDSAGVRPALQLAPDGALVAAWVVARPAGGAELMRGIYPAGDLARGRAEPVASIDYGSGLELVGPWLGLDPAYGYLVWTLQVTQGLNAGSFYSQYLSFALGGGPASPVQTLAVPGGADLTYAGGDGRPAGPRVVLDGSTLRGGSPPTDCAAAAMSGELALLCKAQVQHRRGSRVSQAGAILFDAGRPAGYQLLSFGPGAAYAPALASDRAGQLYASWLVLGDGGFDVYLASTAPDLRPTLSRMGWRDVGRVGFEIISGMVSGALFAPLAALLWAVVPLAILGVTGPLRRDHGELRHWATPLSLGLAMAAYWAGKWLLLADARDYVPFAAWVPGLPGWLGPPLLIGVPLLIGGLGLWAAWQLTYRRENQSVLLFMLAYILVDAPLTMAIYGGVFFGAFYPFA